MIQILPSKKQPARQPVAPKQPARKRSLRGTAGSGSVVALALAAIGVIQFFHPARPAPTGPFAAYGSGLSAGPSLNAFGMSQQLRLRFALPGGEVEFPLEVSGDPADLAYEWVSTRGYSPSTQQRAN